MAKPSNLPVKLPAPLLLLLLLLAALPGCSVYEGVFHPYRLPTPETPPEFKRQKKAKALAAKGRDKAASVKKPKSADPDAADAAAPPAARSGADAGSREEADAGARQPATTKSSVQYDKAGLMKKPKLLRRRITKPPGNGFHPFRVFKNLFKSKPHGKSKPKPDAAPADEPAPPAPDAAPAR